MDLRGLDGKGLDWIEVVGVRLGVGVGDVRRGEERRGEERRGEKRRGEKRRGEERRGEV